MPHLDRRGLRRRHALLRLRHDGRQFPATRSRLHAARPYVRWEYVLDVGHGGHVFRAEVLRHQLRHRHLPDDPGRHRRSADSRPLANGIGQLPPHPRTTPSSPSLHPRELRTASKIESPLVHASRRPHQLAKNRARTAIFEGFSSGSAVPGSYTPLQRHSELGKLSSRMTPIPRLRPHGTAGAGFLARKRQTCLPAYSSRAFFGQR